MTGIETKDKRQWLGWLGLGLSPPTPTEVEVERFMLVAGCSWKTHEHESFLNRSQCEGSNVEWREIGLLTLQMIE
jgi:hypothetical protein